MTSQMYFGASGYAECTVVVGPEHSRRVYYDRTSRDATTLRSVRRATLALEIVPSDTDAGERNRQSLVQKRLPKRLEEHKDISARVVDHMGIRISIKYFRLIIYVPQIEPAGACQCSFVIIISYLTPVQLRFRCGGTPYMLNQKPYRQDKGCRLKLRGTIQGWTGRQDKGRGILHR